MENERPVLIDWSEIGVPDDNRRCKCGGQMINSNWCDHGHYHMEDFHIERWRR